MEKIDRNRTADASGKPSDTDLMPAVAELPDVSEYLSALEKIPVGKRTGKVLVPELKSAWPGWQIAIEFQTDARDLKEVSP